MRGQLLLPSHSRLILHASFYLSIEASPFTTEGASAFKVACCSVFFVSEASPSVNADTFFVVLHWYPYRYLRYYEI